MLKIERILIDGLEENIVTDRAPQISFSLESDNSGESLLRAIILVDEWRIETTDQINNIYDGPMEPFKEYKVTIIAKGITGEKCEKSTKFQTGRLDRKWDGKWITDTSYTYSNKESPVPMCFRKSFNIKDKNIKRAWINSTAFGIYELSLNNKKVGEDYFAPGFTSYDYQLQYQTYDISNELKDNNEIIVVVAGGWACGVYNYNRKSQISADRQAFLCEIHIEYADGTSDLICSDETWQVTTNGPYKAGDWYDGEIFDATEKYGVDVWKKSDITKPRFDTSIIAQYGAPVRKHQTIIPKYVNTIDGEDIYDFGQNFAGVVHARINGKYGQKITFRHSEVLVDGKLFTKSLRTAKATAIYICEDGKQEYSPRFTYMGFRYVGVTGVKKENIELSGFVLYSAIEDNGSFRCSNELINQLQSNIQWGGRSNFVDIPTDCPQRDERLGWTGDIAVFARTACYNFDMSRFLAKWLKDMRSEQGKGGGLPMVIPRAGDAWPVMATSCWGDSSILVPWAEYLARGNKRVLEEHYEAMNRFVNAASWWAGFLSISPTKKYIWSMPFHWGDWCAPEGCAKDWIGRAKWVGTAYYYNSCRIMSEIAKVLNKKSDSDYYLKKSAKIAKAYVKVFIKNGKLKNEFQTGYVLPLYFGISDMDEKLKDELTSNLVKLIEKNDYHIGTGFTGTPYILFALSDNGRSDVAYRLLLQETCPSWLYEVKCGATTIWERWDSLKEDGTVNTVELTGKDKSEEESTGGMVSFNHYANGAVGDWLYRRCLGLEPVTGGYKEFIIKPTLGGNINWATGTLKTPYGTIDVSWEIIGDCFKIKVVVPVSSKCTLIMPNGDKEILSSGLYTYKCNLIN